MDVLPIVEIQRSAENTSDDRTWSPFFPKPFQFPGGVVSRFRMDNERCVLVCPATVASAPLGNYRCGVVLGWLAVLSALYCVLPPQVPPGLHRGILDLCRAQLRKLTSPNESLRYWRV